MCREGLTIRKGQTSLTTTLTTLMRLPVHRTGTASCDNPRFPSKIILVKRFPTTAQPIHKLSFNRRLKKTTAAKICTKYFPNCPSTPLMFNRKCKCGPVLPVQARIVSKIQKNISRTPRNYYNKPPTKLKCKVSLRK